MGETDSDRIERHVRGCGMILALKIIGGLALYLLVCIAIGKFLRGVKRDDR